jgi:N-acetyltransferase
MIDIVANKKILCYFVTRDPRVVVACQNAYLGELTFSNFLPYRVPSSILLLKALSTHRGAILIMATYSRKRPQSFPSSSPLTSISNNTVTSSKRASTASAPSMPPRKKPRLTQMTLDLGQKVHTRCKICNMDYILSSDEDRRLHKKFHDAYVEDNEKGIPLTRATLERARVVARFAPRSARASQSRDKMVQAVQSTGVKRFFTGTATREAREDNTPRHRSAEEQATGQDTIIEIRPLDHWSSKHLAQRVLSVAETELGAVPIDEKQLWGYFSRDEADLVDRLVNKKSIADQDGRLADAHALLMMDRYRVYLYVHEGRAVGLLLAERIREGRVVLDSEEECEEEEEQQDDFGRRKRKTARSATAAAPVEAVAAGATSLPTPPPSSPILAGLDLADTVTTSLPPSSTTLIASTTPTPALLGISRIWVLRPFRSQSIAMALLETARRKMPYGSSDDLDEAEYVSESFAKGVEPDVKVPPDVGGHKVGREANGFVGYEKREVAFSQPTEAGRRLAERWWGGRTGWLVYD